MPTIGPVATATWPAPDGTYYVYVWCSASSNRATNAPYTISYNGGVSDPIEKNQEVDGGQWNYLGTWEFAEGKSGYVQLSDNADEYVIADAIKWELQEEP